LRGATPGEYSMTRSVVPFGTAASTGRSDMSSSLLLSAGERSVVQITFEEIPGRVPARLPTTSSIVTMALPPES
jgi:hypothetical protein